MIEVTPWDLQWRGNILYPVDEKLHNAATEFCKNNLADKLDPRGFSKLWVARRDEEVIGVTGIKSAWDIPLFRSIDERASFKLAERINNHLADQGFRGNDVFLFLSQDEKPEQVCPHRESVLEKVGARPAERYVVTCK